MAPSPEVERLYNDLRIQTARTAYWDAWAQLCWDLYFVVFALGCVLLLLSVLLPRRGVPQVLKPTGFQRVIHVLSGFRREFFQTGGAILLILCALSHQTEIDTRRGFIADQDKHYEVAIKKLAKLRSKEEAEQAEYLYMPQGDSLTYISLGNSAVAADYVWLTSTQYVSSSFRRGRKFDLLNRFYGTMLDLQPDWIEADVNAGKVLSALEQDRFKVEDFYKRAIVKNPESWRLCYEAARLFVVPPLDPHQQSAYAHRATEWYQESLKKLYRNPDKEVIEGVHKQIEGQLARMSIEAGEAGYYQQSAEILYGQAIDTDNPDPMRQSAAIGWLYSQSMYIENEVQKLVDAYHKAHNVFPASLEDALKEAKNIKDPAILRKDVYGFPLLYNAATGQVWSRGARARRAIQAQTMINGLIIEFQASNKRFPRDLDELQQYVNKEFSETGTPRPLTDALGLDVNVRESPLGEPWKYDSNAGAVILAPEYDAGLLFRNAFELMKKSPRKN